MIIFMATQVTTTVVDDLDGSSNARTVSFSLEGVDYRIDLNSKNRAAMQKALKPYLEKATKVGRRTGSPRRSSVSSAKRNDLGAIREWARANGHTVSDRGRVSADIQAAYRAAH